MENYNEQMQELFLRFMVTDPSLIAEYDGYRKTYTFDKPYGMAAKYIVSSYKSFNKIPTKQQIASASGVKGIEPIQEFDQRHREWFINEFDTFLRLKSLDKVAQSKSKKKINFRYDLFRQIDYKMDLDKIIRKNDD